MTSATQGEIAVLVGQIAAVEAALAEARAALERLQGRARRSEALLAENLQALAERAITAARPDPAADAAAPLFSIVLPVRDRSHLVGDAIRSVLAQSIAAWELLIVDDGSTDAIESVVSPFLADPRIRFERQTHAGVCAARNRALALARAPLVAYIDSDNYWLPGFLAAAANAFAAEPAAEVGYAALLRADAPHQLLQFEPFDRERLLARNTIDINVVVHRRHLFERHGGFDESLTRAVDLDLLLRYTAGRPAMQIAALGACYRCPPGPRISRDEPLAPNLAAIRRKWRESPTRRPRVLYAVQSFPQLSESYIAGEMACMRRLGADTEVWAPRAGIAPEAPATAIHRGALADAIRAVRPDIVHVHWLPVLEQERATLAAAGLPVTARTHSFDSAGMAVVRALSLPTLRRIYMMPATFTHDLPPDPRLTVAAPIFDTTLFKPARGKDRRLVLRAMAGLPGGDGRFMLDLALHLSAHQVVLAIARTVDNDGLVDELRAYKQSIGSPAEILVDVPRAEMAALFARAGIFVHTHPAPGAPVKKRVGGPVAIAEAMATGAYVLVRDVPGLVAYAGDAGAAYRNVDGAAALIRATEGWSNAAWHAAWLRSVERAFTHHADEVVLAPMLEDWCALAGERALTTSAAR